MIGSVMPAMGARRTSSSCTVSVHDETVNVAHFECITNAVTLHARSATSRTLVAQFECMTKPANLHVFLCKVEHPILHPLSARRLHSFGASKKTLKKTLYRHAHACKAELVRLVTSTGWLPNLNSRVRNHRPRPRERR